MDYMFLGLCSGTAGIWSWTDQGKSVLKKIANRSISGYKQKQTIYPILRIIFQILVLVGKANKGRCK